MAPLCKEVLLSTVYICVQACLHTYILWSICGCMTSSHTPVPHHRVQGVAWTHSLLSLSANRLIASWKSTTSASCEGETTKGWCQSMARRHHQCRLQKVTPILGTSTTGMRQWHDTLRYKRRCEHNSPFLTHTELECNSVNFKWYQLRNCSFIVPM